MSKEAAAAAVQAKGDEIRAAKAAKQPKEVIMPLVEALKALKAAYEKVAGEPYPAPAPAPSSKKKKKQVTPAPQVKEGGPEGMSKNEVKKAARKAAAAKKKEEKYGNGAAATTSASPKAQGGAGAAPPPVGLAARLRGVSLGGRFAAALAALGGWPDDKLSRCTDADLAAAGLSFRPHRRKLLKILHGEGGQPAPAQLKSLRDTLQGLGAAVSSAPPAHSGAPPAAATTGTKSGGNGAAVPAGASGGGAPPKPPFDPAQQGSAHRFYPMVGLRVMAVREGKWVPAVVSGVPKEDAGMWEVCDTMVDSAWTQRVPYADIGPFRQFPAARGGGAQAGAGAGAAGAGDWRRKLPAASGLVRLQTLPGAAAAAGGGGAEALTIAALHQSCDGIDARIAALEKRRKAAKKA